MSGAVALIGYSGHSWVVADCLVAAGYALAGYCEREFVERNPFHLPFLGFEADAEVQAALRQTRWIVAVGDNRLRARIQTALTQATGGIPIVARHPSAVVSASAHIGAGSLLAPLAVVNAGAEVSAGVILNSGAIVEHECIIGEFAHVAPRAVLAGNVTVGPGALIGVGAVVRPGVRIGAHALVGAGAVVVRDVPDGARVAGNPARVLAVEG